MYRCVIVLCVHTQYGKHPSFPLNKPPSHFLMTLSPQDFLSTEDMENFASFLGLEGIDSDMFYESYFNLNVDDEYNDDEYREERTNYYTY